MSRVKSFGMFWYDFIVGDDWRVAVIVVLGLVVTALLAHVAKVNAWWLLPLCALGALAWAVHRATASAVASARAAAAGTGSSDK